MQTNDGTCAHDDCEEPTPWDMAAIIVGDAWYCSPECAIEGVAAAESPPKTVTLHDPQYTADRDELPGVSAEAVNITRPVSGRVDADEAIRTASEVYGGKFRLEE
jgi:hypothetical protein